MPFKSESQRRYFWSAVNRGDIKRSVAEEWEKHTSPDKLPERVKQKAKHAEAILNACRPLEKDAARAGLTLIRNLLAKGTSEALAKAQQLAKAPGVIKPSTAGSQIARLGRGGEGIATAVADPELGVAVRKLYDPTSELATRKMIARKVQMGKEIKDPALADFLGFRRTQARTPMTFHEYVQQAPVSREVREEAAKRVRAAAAERGFVAADVGGSNIVGGKVVDPLYFRPGEYVSQTGGALDLTPRGYQTTGHKMTPAGFWEKARRQIDDPIVEESWKKLTPSQRSQVQRMGETRGAYTARRGRALQSRSRAEGQLYRLIDPTKAAPGAAGVTPKALQGPVTTIGRAGRKTPSAGVAPSLPKMPEAPAAPKIPSFGSMSTPKPPAIPGASQLQSTAIGRKPKAPALG